MWIVNTSITGQNTVATQTTAQLLPMPKATPPAAPGSGVDPAPQAPGTGWCVFPELEPRGPGQAYCPPSQKAWGTAAGSVLRG